MAAPGKPERLTKRQRLDAAFRVRAGMQGLLACCSCEYPIAPAMTATGHAETCQAHGFTLAMLVAGTAWSLTWTKSGVFKPPADEPTTTKRKGTR